MHALSRTLKSLFLNGNSRRRAQLGHAALGGVEVCEARLLLTGLDLRVTSAHAVEIPIANSSFESQQLSDGSWIEGALEGWALDGHFAGPQNWQNAQFGGSDENDNAPSIFPHGKNSAFSRGPTISQVLSSNLEAYTTYVLSVEVGHRADGAFGEYRVQLVAGGEILAENDASQFVAPGEFITSTVVYSSTVVSSPEKLPLEVRLVSNIDDPSGYTQVQWDNVRLTKQNTPPATQSPVFELQWLPSPDPDGFFVEHSSSPIGPFTVIGQRSATQTSFSDTGDHLSFNEPHYYRVRSDTDADKSEVVSAFALQAQGAPAVEEVLVRNTSWSAAYSQGLTGRSEWGKDGFMRTDAFLDDRLPQVIDTIAVKFSEDVHISATDVALTSGFAKENGTSQEIPLLSALYDPESFTMTVTFEPPTVDTIKLTVDSTVTSVATGASLEGVASPDSSDYASVFTKVFRILPGDANNDGIVTVGTTYPDLGDLLAIYQAFGTHISGANIGREYDLFADVNADGMVWQGDIFALYENIGRREFATPDDATFAPKIHEIQPLQIEEDAGPQTVAFRVGSSSSESPSLTVTARSSDQELLPDSNISFGPATGSDRELTFTVPDNLHGDVTITLEITDGTRTSERAFQVSIAPVNDAPEFTAVHDGGVYEFTPLETLEFVPESDETHNSHEFDYEFLVTDPDVATDDDRVWFIATSTNESVARAFVAGTTLRIETLNPGSALVTVTSIDRAGEEVVKTIPVTVTLRDLIVGDIGDFAMLRTTREISNRQDRVEYLNNLGVLTFKQMQELQTRNNELAALESHFFQSKRDYESKLSFGTQLDDVARGNTWNEVFANWQLPASSISGFTEHATDVNDATAVGQLFLRLFNQLVMATPGEEFAIAEKVGYLLDISPEKFLLNLTPTVQERPAVFYSHLKNLFTVGQLGHIFSSSQSSSSLTVAPDRSIYKRGDSVRIRFDLPQLRNGELLDHVAVYAIHEGEQFELPVSPEVSTQLFVYVPVDAISGFLPRTLDTSLPVDLKLAVWFGTGGSNTGSLTTVNPIYVPPSNDLTQREEWELVESFYRTNTTSAGVEDAFGRKTVLSNLFTGIAQELISTVYGSSQLTAHARSARLDRVVTLASRATGIAEQSFRGAASASTTTAFGAAFLEMLQRIEPINRPGMNITENLPNTIYILPRNSESNTLRAVVNLADEFRDGSLITRDQDHPEDRRNALSTSFDAATNGGAVAFGEAFGGFYPIVDVSTSSLGGPGDLAAIHGETQFVGGAENIASTGLFSVPGTDFSTLPVTPDNLHRRTMENVILNQISSEFVLNNPAGWTWLLASTAHVDDAFHALDLSRGVATDKSVVTSPAAGTVRHNKKDSYGNPTIVIEHVIDDGGKPYYWYTKYLHMYPDTSNPLGPVGPLRADQVTVDPLAVGATVATGTMLGNVGGFEGFTPHLHFEVFASPDGRQLNNYFATNGLDLRKVVSGDNGLDIGVRASAFYNNAYRDPQLAVTWNEEVGAWISNTRQLIYDRHEMSPATPSDDNESYWLAWHADATQRRRVSFNGEHWTTIDELFRWDYVNREFLPL